MPDVHAAMLRTYIAKVFEKQTHAAGAMLATSKQNSMDVILLDRLSFGGASVRWPRF